MHQFASILSHFCLKILNYFNFQINLTNSYVILKELLPKDCDIYFAQEGEDALIERLLERKEYDKFYIDIGAHHPYKFSNTSYFYLNGWRGINIDPLPGMKKIFDKYRPGDINLEICISDKNEELDYYILSQPAFNSCNYKNVEDILKLKPHVQLIKKIKIEAHTTSYIIENYLPKITSIGFLSIDTEGWDSKIIQFIDLNKYRPKLLLIENLGCNLETIYTNDISNFQK